MRILDLVLKNVLSLAHRAAIEEFAHPYAKDSAMYGEKMGALGAVVGVLVEAITGKIVSKRARKKITRLADKLEKKYHDSESVLEQVRRLRVAYGKPETDELPPLPASKFNPSPVVSEAAIRNTIH